MKTVNTLMTIIGLTLCVSAAFAACDSKVTQLPEQKDAEVVNAPEVVDAGVPAVDAGSTDQ